MDIKELDKRQLILLTLLITFVVSLATGIVTVSLMNQMPKNVPQTINNVIQRTIEKVTMVQAPASTETSKTENDVVSNKENPSVLLGNSDALVSIYSKNAVTQATSTTEVSNGDVPKENTTVNDPVAIGQGIIISDVGLVLVDSSLIKENETYKVVLNKTDFDVTLLKKFDNGFSVLKISTTKDAVTNTTDTTATTQ